MDSILQHLMGTVAWFVGGRRLWGCGLGRRCGCLVLVLQAWKGREGTRPSIEGLTPTQSSRPSASDVLKTALYKSITMST